MPAMWDNQKMANGGAAVATAPGQPKLVPPPTLKQRAYRSQAASAQQQQQQQQQQQYHHHHQQQQSNGHHRYDSRNQTFDDLDERSFWQNDFDSRINGLGIQGSTSRYEIRRGKAVPRHTSGNQRQISPPPDSSDQGAPPLHHPPPRNPLRLNPHHWRPTSSLYLEEEEVRRDFQHKSKKPSKAMYRRPGGLNISPPSSPELGATHGGAYPDDVSPVDDDADVSQQELLRGAQITPPPQQPQSHIPTMRRQRRAEHQRAASSNLKESRSQDKLRDPHGDTSHHHPWEGPNPAEASMANQQGFGLTTTVTGPSVPRTGNPGPSLGQRMRQLTRGKNEPLESRPPWKGASGRAPMVDPVQDDLGVAPLAVQRKNSKHGLRAGRVTPETSTTAATVRRLLPSRSNQKLEESAKTPSPEPVSHGPAHAYPSPPYNDSPTLESQPPAPPPQAAQRVPLNPRLLPDHNRAIRRKPSPSTFAPSHVPQNSTSSSQYSAWTDQSVSTYAPHLDAASPLSLFGNLEPWVQPPSRFSVTTCNTVIPDSPQLDEEEQPPVPPMPPIHTMPTPPLATTPPTPEHDIPSVMDRRRPIFGGERARTPPSKDAIVISIKSSVAASPKPEAVDTDRPPSLVSTAKELPPVPPEKMSANDRVAYLNARLDSLSHRRLNINKSIKQMTELMPAGSLMSSAEVLRKRESEKQKVEGLKKELSEIQIEEYDLGLKLYRANKRLERESNFEGSSLWVRRATSA